MTEFPGNSNVSPKKPAQKKVQQVVTGRVVQRKKPWWKKLKASFTGDDSRSVIEYVWTEIIIPGAKDIVADTITQGVERKIFGEVRSRGRFRGGPSSSIFGNATYNAYNRYATPGSTLRPDPRQSAVPANRGRAQMQDIGELIFDNRGAAADCLDAMIACANQYESVTVEDLFEIIGRTGEYTGLNFGWTPEMLLAADVHHIQGQGFLLNLPSPTHLGD